MTFCLFVRSSTSSSERTSHGWAQVGTSGWRLVTPKRVGYVSTYLTPSTQVVTVLLRLSLSFFLSIRILEWG